MFKDLLDQIEVFVSAAVADLAMEQPHSTELGSVQVFKGAVPKDEGSDEAFPCVVVRWSSGEDDEEGYCTERVDLLCGVYSRHGFADAEDWIAVVTGRLRCKLSALKHLGSWELVRPVKFAKPEPEEQHKHMHIGVIRTKWQGQYLLGTHTGDLIDG